MGKGMFHATRHLPLTRPAPAVNKRTALPFFSDGYLTLINCAVPKSDEHRHAATGKT
jgi:hypothetical protein